MANKKTPKHIKEILTTFEKDNVVNISASKARSLGSSQHIKIDPNERDYQITGATIKDMLCNYNYTVTGELNAGETGAIKGPGVVDKDLLSAMARFNVHLACLDDAFKTANIEIGIDNEFKNIDTLRSHELTGNYIVTGFIIRGGVGNESLILIGTKYISMCGDHMELKTPKIPLANGSSYTWHNELSEVCELVREEVALYREGKYTEKEPKEKKEDKSGDLFKKGKLTGEALDELLSEESDNEDTE